MSQHRKASPEDLAAAQALGAELGIDVVAVFERDMGSPLIHGYWNGAPVAISLRTGLAGGLGVAFYMGPGTEFVDEDGETGTTDEWDEVLDTQFAGPEAALVLAAAALDRYGRERAEKYAGVRLASAEDALGTP